jgi:hypothetical protein
MEALSMATTGFEQPSDGFLRDFRESRGGADTTSFVEMINDFLSFGFTDLGIEPGGVTSFRELFTTLATAQQMQAILAIDLSNGEIALMRTPNILAFWIDTG